MTNHNPSLTNEQIKQLLENSFGPIHSIVTPYDNPYQRNIEFMDIRHAQKGRQAIGLSAKIPTISEVGVNSCTADFRIQTDPAIPTCCLGNTFQPCMHTQHCSTCMHRVIRCACRAELARTMAWRRAVTSGMCSPCIPSTHSLGPVRPAGPLRAPMGRMVAGRTPGTPPMPMRSSTICRTSWGLSRSCSR